MTDTWPLFDLVLRTPKLVLRVPADRDLDDLAQLAVDGIHDPDVQPFGDAWTDKDPEDLARGVHQWEWGRRAAWKPQDWTCAFVVSRRDNGQTIGVQSVSGRDFAILREVRTGSWLGRRHQGQGFGTQMRAAVLDLAFTGLDAVLARTCCHEDNVASRRVSGKLGYEYAGSRRIAVRGKPVREDHFELDRALWRASGDSGDTAIIGLPACREWFGAAE